MKFGRRPPKRAASLKLGSYLTGVVPAHPAASDYLGQTGWQMLGNDKYGDCVAVTLANTKRIITRTLGPSETYMSLDQVLAIYKTQNPGFPVEDNGMDIQTLLEWLVKNGWILGFASVDYTNVDEVKAAIAIFGSVWVGFDVLEANMDQFNESLPWDYSRSPLAGGHSVIVGGYGPAAPGALGGDERFITWAQETSFTDSFWSHQVEEAWVTIWPQHLGSKSFLAGVDLATLVRDYTAITGRPFPAPVPAPPGPAPTPTPTPKPPKPPRPPAGCFQWLRDLIDWLGQRFGW